MANKCIACTSSLQFIKKYDEKDKNLIYASIGLILQLFNLVSFLKIDPVKSSTNGKLYYCLMHNRVVYYSLESTVKLRTIAVALVVLLK